MLTSCQDRQCLSVVRIAFLAILFAGCGDPSDVGDLTMATLCGGYVESEHGAARSDFPEGCSRVTVIAPTGSLLTRASASACDVASEGAPCMILGPGEEFLAWSQVQHGNRRVEWLSSPVSCDATCEP